MADQHIQIHFGKKSTVAEVLANVDLTDKLVILTGGTSGIGIAMAEGLVA